MARLGTTLIVHAPVEVVFDLARDVEEHTAALAHTGERLVPPGRTSGLLEVGDLVCFRARHFGLPWAMTSAVAELDRPTRLVDEQITGPFRSLRHEHLYSGTPAGTLVTDLITWRSPLGVLGTVADNLAVRWELLRVLQARGAHLKRRAEVLAASAATRPPGS